MTKQLPCKQAQCKIVVAVPTCKRPQMLRACLQSLVAIRIPVAAEVVLLVSDNDAGESAREVVESIVAMPGLPFAVQYTVARQRGLASNRNHIIACALALDADYLACVDDDSTVGTEWLAQHFATIRDSGADAVRGPSLQPHQMKRGISTRWQRRRWVSRISTGNIITAMRLYRSDGLGLRFDERLNFIGFEDLDFFERASERGARLLMSPVPIAYESADNNKRSFTQHAMFAFQRYANRQIEKKRRGKSALHIFISALLYFIAGLALLLPAFLFANIRPPCTSFFIKSAALFYSTCCAKQFEVYRNIAGH